MGKLQVFFTKGTKLCKDFIQCDFSLFREMILGEESWLLFGIQMVSWFRRHEASSQEL